MHHIDLNCDLGESFGAYQKGKDEQVLEFVTSANIACGFHAGDPGTMRKTVQLAMDKHVAIGAHPGFPDLVGFGRRLLDASAQEVYDMTVYQIGALYGFVKAEGGQLHHVKPHGALYNVAAKRLEIATAIARAVYDVFPELILYGLSGSRLIEAGRQVGLQTASEVFADRTYQTDGSLTDRREVNALIESDEAAMAHVIRMVEQGKVKTVQGEEVGICAETVCVHGDGAHALEFAKGLNETLRSRGIQLRAVERTYKELDLTGGEA